MMNGIRLQLGVELKPNAVRKAIVKTVSYEEPELNTCGLQKIVMETEDRLKANWEVNWYSHPHYEKFWKTREDILARKIVPGTKVTIEYNDNGIMCFYLEEEP